MAYYQILKDRGLTFDDTPQVGAAYIMNDGKFLSITNNKNILQEHPSPTKKCVHYDLDFFLFKEGILPEKRVRVLLDSDNAIRLNDGTNFIQESAYMSLPVLEPSAEQYLSLLAWLDYVMTISKTIQIEDGNKQKLKVYEFVSLENENGWTSDNIINDIKRIYREEEL